MSYFVHKTAIIDKSTIIGENCKIWHFSHILSGSVIGEGCSFGQNCVVGPNVQMGKNCKVQNNVSVYEGVVCEDNVFLGPSMVFTNVVNPRAFINRREEFKMTLLKNFLFHRPLLFQQCGRIFICVHLLNCSLVTPCFLLSRV